MSQLPATDVVVAARNGDRRALDVLVSGYLPLVYNLIGAAAEADLDVDDIVQDTMLRVVGGIGGVRDAERVRSWVVSIALRQLSDARSTAGRERAQRGLLPEDRTDLDAEFEGAVLLREDLGREQREIARAVAWLDPAHREVLSLWWLELRGELSRAEVAAALGDPVANTGVRVQRMREQLETARLVVGALDGNPRCGELAQVVGEWDGEPSPLWRKRIARHVRDCPACTGRTQRLTGAGRLLATVPLLVPPRHLAAALKRTAFTHGRVAVKVAATVAAMAIVVAGVLTWPRRDPVPQTAFPVAPAPVTAVPPATPDAAVAVPSKSLSPAPSRSAAEPPNRTITDLGVIRQATRVAGRDNGQSVGYQGRSVWIFDDTTLKDPFDFLSNSAAITTDLDASDGIDLRAGGTPTELIPRTDAEKAFEAADGTGAVFGFWPGPVFADPARHRVLFTYGKLCRGGKDGTPCTGPLGKGLGTGIAAMDMDTGKVTRLRPSAAPTVTSVEGIDHTMFFGPDDGFGAAAMVKDETLYLYGQCSYGCRLARVPLADLADRGAWRFYAGTRGWQANPGSATRLIAPGGAGQSVFYSAYLRKYVNVYLPYNSAAVKYQTAAQPWGPWSKERTLTTAAKGSYALFAHPEYAEDGGRIQYLSYFVPGTGAQRLLRWDLR